MNRYRSARSLRHEEALLARGVRASRPPQPAVPRPAALRDRECDRARDARSRRARRPHSVSGGGGRRRTGRLAAGTPLLVLLLALMALPLAAQSVAVTPQGSFVVAHDGIVELFASNGYERLWRSDGVEYPGAVVAGESSIAVLDPIANRAVVADIRTGASTSMRTGETPIDGAFVGGDLYLVERDARALERIAPDGTRASISLAADPAFLRIRDARLFVYSRVAGVIQEIATAPFRVARTVAAEPFASDFETDGRTAYTVHPRDGFIRMVDLATGKPAGHVRIGAVPVDLAFAGSGTALSAPMLAVADPSAKRVWVVEGKQSVMQAFARGFLRGLIGLGLFGGRESKFRTGVDRVVIRGPVSIAYDSSSGTLYRFSKEKIEVLAHPVAPGAFAVGPSGVAWWQDGTLVAQKANR